MTIELPEVSAVGCGRCGASLSLTALAGQVTCPHCGHRQPLDPQLHERLAGYRRAVEAVVPAIVARLSERGLWAHRRATGAARMWALVAFAVVFLLALLVGLPMALVLARTRVVPLDESIPWLLGGLAVVLVLTLAIAVISWSGAGRKETPPRVVLPDVAVACSGCGGENVMTSGAAVGACSFCAAQLVASREKVALVVHTARRILRGAHLEQHRARRATYLPRSNLPLLRRNDEALYRRSVAAAYEDRAAAAAARWFEELATALGGRCLLGDATVEWFDRSWPAVYAGLDYFWQHPRFAVALERDGYPVLVDRCRAPDERRALVESLCVLLAAGEPVPDALPPSAAESLAQLGFTLRAMPTGLLASSGPDLAARLLAQPPAAERMTTVVARVVEIARAMRLAPPEEPLSPEAERGAAAFNAPSARP